MKTHNTGETIFVNVEGQVNSHMIGVIPGTGALMMLRSGDLCDKQLLQLRCCSLGEGHHLRE